MKKCIHFLHFIFFFVRKKTFYNIFLFYTSSKWFKNELTCQSNHYVVFLAIFSLLENVKKFSQHLHLNNFLNLLFYFTLFESWKLLVWCLSKYNFLINFFYFKVLEVFFFIFIQVFLKHLKIQSQKKNLSRWNTKRWWARNSNYMLLSISNISNLCLNGQIAQMPFFWQGMQYQYLRFLLFYRYYFFIRCMYLQNRSNFNEILLLFTLKRLS